MPQKRISGLDALRGIAALAVAITHFSNTYYAIYGLQKPWFAVDLGEQAVSLFFIISGFVILMSLDKSESVSDFAVSRFSRLFPVFWVAILITFAVVHLAHLPGRETSVMQAVLNAGMMPSQFGVPAVDVVYWTLTVELFFYFMLATIRGCGLRRLLVPILWVLVIAGVLNQHWPIDRFPGGYRIEHILNLGYWPLFLLGITIYQAAKGWKREQIISIALCVAVSSPVHSALALCVYIATRYAVPALTSRPLLFLGKISYSFYLIHANVGYCLIRWALGHGFAPASALLIALPATALLGSALCFAVEMPTNRLLRRAWGKKTITGSVPREESSRVPLRLLPLMLPASTVLPADPR